MQISPPSSSPSEQRSPLAPARWPAPLCNAGQLLELEAYQQAHPPPPEFLCPITLCLMQQPAYLVAEDLPVISCYEREAVEKALVLKRCWVVGCRLHHSWKAAQLLCV